jgi:transposase InsO family protein
MSVLLVVIDVFTGFVVLRPLKASTADLVAKELWLLFAMFGLPKIVQSDNGSEFVNQVLRELVILIGVEHRFISPYNPRADGKVERSIGTVMGVIKKLLHGTEKLWPMYVSFAQLSFNNKIAALTGSTPFRSCSVVHLMILVIIV